jgi:hypothetical protein
MMRRALLLAGLLAFAPSAAQVSERPDSVRVTVYHGDDEGDPTEFRNPDPEQGLVFVSETRTVEVPAGPATIEFRGVASTIIPETVAIDGLPVPLLERNFDYDLLSPGSLLAKSVGETVTLRRIDRKTGKPVERSAVVRTGPNGVVLDFGGTYEALGCGGLKESLIFSKVPDGLRDTPTLSIRTNAPQAGRYTITLSYLATKVNWAANYVARLHGDRLDLSGWVTLTNAGETSFRNAPLDIIAGTVQREPGEDVPVEPPHIRRQDGCWPTYVRWWWNKAIYDRLHGGAAPLMMSFAAKRSTIEASDVGSLETVAVTGFRASQDLGDYKLYSLEGTTDVLARQTKLVHLLDQKDVPFQRVYYFGLASDEDQHVAHVALRMKNTKENHLGLALPAGMLTATDVSGDGAPVVLGRANFRDYSVGSPIELEMGQAFDVYVRQTKISNETRGSGADKLTRATGEIVIENHKTVAIDFEFRLPVLDTLKIVSESQRHTATPNGLTWSFHLAPGEKKPLRLTIERRR